MRPRTLFMLLLTAAVVHFAADLRAQAKPNFSGDWSLVLDKSDFGGMTTPATMTRTVTHTEPTMKVVSHQTGGDLGDVTTTMNYTTDEKPTTNTLQGNAMTSITKWDGTALVVKSSLSIQGVNIAISDRWELSDAGKTLTIVRNFSSPEGELATKLVFTKTK